MSENVGASTSRNPKSLHGLYRENFTFTFIAEYYTNIHPSTPIQRPLTGGTIGGLLGEVSL
jgi:hypothetical protein